MNNTPTQIDERPWETLVDLAQQGDHHAVNQQVSECTASDQAYLIAHLDESEVESVVGALTPTAAAELISHLSETQAAGLLANLEADAAAAILRELPADEQADILADLSDHQSEAILGEFPASEAEQVRVLAAYDENVAGGLMTRDLLKLSVDSTIAEAIGRIGETLDELGDDDIRYGYVVDGDDRLVGVLPMQNLLFVKRSTRVADSMIANPKTVRDSASLDELIDLFDVHHFLGIPVTDEEGRLCGVVHRDRVNRAEGEVAESAYLKSQGIVGGEELRTMPVAVRSRRRLSWLSVNILLNIGAASVVALFQETLQSVIALAVFLPIISDMSGCSGNQAVAVSMRELSLGLIRPTEVLRVWLQEMSVGLVNGLALGLLVALAGYIYQGNVWLGGVVGIALFVNTIVAVSIGGTVPLIVKRFGFDPAIASGPLLTTITDMRGFFLVLGMASQIIERLN
ncbi:MAG: magnesium transporter [Planctomycetota bacterium]